MQDLRWGKNIGYVNHEQDTSNNKDLWLSLILDFYRFG
jgi:hypothetical protein